MLQDPINFISEIEINGNLFNYSSLFEIVQGGPEVGFFSINNRQIQGVKFGGPFITNGNYVYIPMFVKKWYKSGFQLAQIDIRNLNVKPIGKIKDIVFIEKVEDDNIIVFEDLNKTIRKLFPIPS